MCVYIYLYLFIYIYIYVIGSGLEGPVKALGLLLRKELCNEATGAPLTFVLRSLSCKMWFGCIGGLRGFGFRVQGLESM